MPLGAKPRRRHRQGSNRAAARERLRQAQGVGRCGLKRGKGCLSISGNGRVPEVYPSLTQKADLAGLIPLSPPFAYLLHKGTLEVLFSRGSDAFGYPVMRLIGDLMRRLLFGTLALCQLASASLAAATCASPQEVKALQAAALEQQLAAAAQSCHLSMDYGLFVAKFRDPIVRSDRAVRAFFQHRNNSEGYDAYKARIAEDASLRSLHDPQFCRSAKAVFDMALGRGSAEKRPAMLQTGYEHCRARVAAAAVHAVGPAD